MGLFGGIKTTEQKKADLVYVLEGLKGLYTGYYTSFYKSTKIASLQTCLNEETIDDIVRFEEVIEDPLSLIYPFDLTKDMHLFGAASQIGDDMVKCNF